MLSVDSFEGGVCAVHEPDRARYVRIPASQAAPPRDTQAPVDGTASGALSLPGPGAELDLDAELRTRFGLAAFRPWQREAITELLEGSGRCLVVAPTGGGKSLTYQFPASLLPGTTVVVSPLIALMEDQVRSLTERGIPATFLASTVGAEERRERERGLAEGRYRLVYVAPERLATGALVERLARLRPPLVAIDEAHCIAQWGHDFRPDYLRIGALLEALRPQRVLACTATATPSVRREILERLGMDVENTKVVLRGFARPNLHLSTVDVEKGSQRRGWMTGAVEEAIGKRGERGGAIVYCATRRATEEIAPVFKQRGYRVSAYHAGLDPETRSEVGRAFAARELDVVVATNAFGMGIDRPDIRCVVHAQMPGSIEAYYQEVGRAGRDGQPAWGVLLSAPSDIGLRKRILEHGKGNDVDPAEVKRQWNLFLDLLRYVDAGSCRHDFILRYFGDEQELLGGCGHCDTCERLERDGEGTRQASEDDALVVRKALAAVARAQRRAGMIAIADMLRGESTVQQQRWGFTQLSTFGLLKDKPQAWLVSLLRRLMTAGLIELTSGEFPVPYLTSTGAKVMKAEEPVRVLVPPTEREPGERGGKGGGKGTRFKRGSGSALARGGSKSSDDGPALGPTDARAFERLRAVRLALAKEQDVPAYVICPDRVLKAIALARPGSKTELATVKGMGPSRIDAYGEELLAALDAD